jgi:hypothetical protein
MPPHQLLGGSLAGKESGPYTSSTRPVESIEGSRACSCSVMPTLCRALTTPCMRCGGCQLDGQFRCHRRSPGPPLWLRMVRDSRQDRGVGEGYQGMPRLRDHEQIACTSLAGLGDRGKTDLTRTNTVASPGFACSLSELPAVSATTV